MEMVGGDGDDEEEDDDDAMVDHTVEAPILWCSFLKTNTGACHQSAVQASASAMRDLPASPQPFGQHRQGVEGHAEHKAVVRQPGWMLAANKRQKHREWPPWKDDLEDEDDLDGMQGCKYCVDKPLSPQRAWNAFYEDRYSLRDSWCIGKRCEDPAWAEEEEKKEKAEDELEMSGAVGEDLNKNSSEECPLIPAEVLPPSHCLSPGWGAFLPSSVQQELPSPLQLEQSAENEEEVTALWRPWETGDMLHEGSAGKTEEMERTDEQSQGEADEEMGIGKVGEDLNTNSQECPSLPAVPLPSPCLSPGWGSHLPSSLQQNTPGTLWRPWGPVKDSPTRMTVEELGAAASFQKSLVTPHNLYFSSVKTAVNPCQPKRVIRKARKRRSPGELARRRSRLFSFQFNQAPFTPYTPEPDVSRLESGSRGGGLSQRRLDWSSSGFTGEDGGNEVWGSRGLGTDSWRTPLGHREPVEQYSNQTNNNLLYPPLPKTWWPSPSWVPTSSPGPPSPPACPPGYTAPPSPAYCDGCHRWGNLLAVTVSQTRGL